MRAAEGEGVGIEIIAERQRLNLKVHSLSLLFFHFLPAREKLRLELASHFARQREINLTLSMGVYCRK